jgi:hypothetical protein
MRTLVDYIRGHWSASAPAREGIYLVREPGGARSWVAYWTPDSSAPFGSARREFFHLEDDEDGQPTRWDDDRIATLAKAGGWRETADERRR